MPARKSWSETWPSNYIARDMNRLFIPRAWVRWRMKFETMESS